MPVTQPYAAQLVAAHREGGMIAAPPVPADIAGAMAIQSEVAEGLGRGVGGWKVAVHPEAGPLAAPLMDHLILESPARWPFSPGLAIEVEVAVRLKNAVPAGTRDRAVIVAAVESMMLGIELVLPRVAAGAPLLSYLADNLGNAGYVAGNRRMPWRDCDPGDFALSVTSEGKSLFSGPCSFPIGDPLAPILATATAENGARTGFAAGHLVTTGSFCGLIAIPGPGRLVAGVEGFGQVEILFE